jgi:hypothetical protein
VQNVILHVIIMIWFVLKTMFLAHAQIRLDIIFNYCFPLKKVNAFKYGFRKPWLSKGLLKSIKRKNKLFKKYLSIPCPINENVYKKFRNKLNNNNNNNFI